MQEENNNKNGSENNNEPKKKNKNIFFVYGAILVGILLLQFVPFKAGTQEIGWETLNNLIQNGYVTKIDVINRDYAEIYVKETNLEEAKKLAKTDAELEVKGPQFKYVISSPEGFDQKLEQAQSNLANSEKIYTKNIKRKDIWGEAIGWLLPILLLVFLWFFMFRRVGGGAGGSNIFSMGKSRAKLFEGSKIKITFDNVAGLYEAKQEIVEIVDFLKSPDKYTKLGGKIPKGVLLVGPPGTGKTLLAKAVAGEAEVPFFSMSGSDFVEMFVGVGASRVRDLFAQAKAKAPCIIFIDEIDAVGRSRSKKASFSSNDERENTLNQLLTEMDGFDTNTGVILLAATNRADILDSALLRAGRFDRQIMLDLPDLKEREEIFKVHTTGLTISKDLNLNLLSKQTPGFSGADIANVCNEAALIAARKGKEMITHEDFHDAIDKVIGGLEKRSKVIKPEEKKRIAFHEAGHATVSWMLEHAQPLIKVTIVPRGRSLGAAWYLPEERQLTTRQQFYDELCATLGGRAAEEIMLKNVSSGALNDLERVTKQAYSMIVYFGMSDKLPNVSYYDSSGQEYAFTKPYSEKTAEIIDSEVQEIINVQYKRAKQIILDNLEKFEKLSQRLHEKEVIFTEDVEDFLGKRVFNSDAQDVIDGVKKFRDENLKKEQEEIIKEQKQAEDLKKESEKKDKPKF
ncbi:MAG: ATP-dependent zinc metalloprotease FtsH [Bacteroidales bacterium]|nr:ATP-dependent zinc metalloprotease FtsH [Bacteroidales bacterium]